MRVVRLAEIPVVVHINDHDKVTVVVPANLAPSETLSMARLVLSPDELNELTNVIDGPSGDTQAKFG